MNDSAPNWMLIAFGMCFAYKIIGSLMLLYLDQKFYEVECHTNRWAYLYRMVKGNLTDRARIYYHMQPDKYDEEIIPPLQEGIWFWGLRLLTAIPAGLAMIILAIVTHLSTAIFGGVPFQLTPNRFSFLEALLWPRTFIRDCRQIGLNHENYEKCKAFVKSRIDARDQLA